MRFALENDAAKMMSQWTDDMVLLQPVGPILRGRRSVVEALGAGAASVEILDYVLDIEQTTVAGDHAGQWGTYRHEHGRSTGAIGPSTGRRRPTSTARVRASAAGSGWPCSTDRSDRTPGP